MTRWVALLRGVNVGGTGKLPMKEFRAELAALGFDNVATYIQSGNAVFDAPGPAADIEKRIRAVLARAFDLDRPVLVIGGAAFTAAIAADPFSQVASDPKLRHLVFMAPQCALDLDAVRAAAVTGEQIEQVGSVAYLFTPGGFGTSKLAGKLERFFDGPITCRNLRSCHAIAELLAD